MRKLLHKTEKFCKYILVNAHRNVFWIKYYAMFIVIDIRWILKPPLIPVNFNRNYSECLSCRSVYISAKTLIFHAQHTDGIIALHNILNRSCINFSFRLWKINSYIKLTTRCFCWPFHIFLYSVTPYIIRITAKIIEIIRCRFRRNSITLPKLFRNGAWAWCKHPHNLCVEKVTFNYIIAYYAVLTSIVQNFSQCFFKVRFFIVLLRFFVWMEI